MLVQLAYFTSLAEIDSPNEDDITGSDPLLEGGFILGLLVQVGSEELSDWLFE